ncbi:ribonuclease HI large subunit [Microthyrium microscopicum]|uniref:Ribonuclease n=1 Tax=Microthyrium microscopicum TaxID=703497 RepID=A0A6A6UJD0_9PEZI|nr:ribonuclease HI large subunit [Microthyrium microscopicum]
MADSLEDQNLDSQQIELETPADGVFQPPSINAQKLLRGISYSHFSPLPQVVQLDTQTECVLGVDEAGRGPVLGPMVYGVFYLPKTIETSLLADTHHFDDSKVLTPQTRSNLMETLCTADTDLFTQCGWATCALSAQSISAGMMQPAGSYNLNAQAMDATIELVRGVLDRGVNVTEMYVDTIGRPEVYQRKLQHVFPNLKITVAKKADSLYPCVSAASVCAKVTRDAALETCAEAIAKAGVDEVAWGSGYPSDARCVTWLKANMDPVFGWGPECRFSWGTSKELLEGKKNPLKVDWPVEEDENGMKMTSFFVGKGEEIDDELADWYGKRVGAEVF